MARIRTIKPEFQNSQSMGRVSRDARLTFVELWPQCDDAGRIRANSRMLASVLFPYDEDAPKLIDGWLSELEKEGCLVRYSVGSDDYIQISHWDHQKIDHPQPSKLPPAPEKKAKKTKLSVREQSSKPREPSPVVRAVSSTVSDSTGEEGIKDRIGDACAEIVSEQSLAIQAFNEVAKELKWPEAQRVSPGRAAKLVKRLSECGGIDGWRAAMAKARASPWLRGDVPRGKGFESWAPDLDFFLQESSFTKLMEGKYDQRGRTTATGFDAIREGASRAAGLDRKPGPGMEGAGDSLVRLAISDGSSGNAGRATGAG